MLISLRRVCTHFEPVCTKLLIVEAYSNKDFGN